MENSFILEKMTTKHFSPVEYRLTNKQGEELVLNQLLDKKITLTFLQMISCLHCGKKTNKSFGQGYCFNHFSTLACNDICMVKPELCHYRFGTCREPKWGEEHCLKPHIIYLANSSGLKVGMTRETQIPTRWIDQGATTALPILKVYQRWHAGVIEVLLAKEFADKTNWRAMLQGKQQEIDLVQIAEDIRQRYSVQFDTLVTEDPHFCYQWLDFKPISFEYPVIEFPNKINSLSFDKTSSVTGRLLGIKGQYLIFDHGVLNIRKHGGYNINVEILNEE